MEEKDCKLNDGAISDLKIAVGRDREEEVMWTGMRYH